MDICQIFFFFKSGGISYGPKCRAGLSWWPEHRHGLTVGNYYQCAYYSRGPDDLDSIHLYFYLGWPVPQCFWYAVLQILGEIFQTVCPKSGHLSSLIWLTPSGSCNQEKLFLMKTFTYSKSQCALCPPFCPHGLHLTSSRSQLSPRLLYPSLYWRLPISSSTALIGILPNCKSQPMCHPSVQNLSMAPYVFRITWKCRTSRDRASLSHSAHSSPHTFLIPTRLQIIPTLHVLSVCSLEVLSPPFLPQRPHRSSLLIHLCPLRTNYVAQ